jgi:ADP-ribose pyrophosphatase YjhB (NUDIX family)
MEIKLQVGVKIFLKNSDNKYLLVKRSLQKYKGVKGSWDIVGGRIDPGSILLDNLAREVYEETQLEIKSKPILLYAQDIIPNEEKHIIRLTYKGETDGEPILDMEENLEYKWLTINEMKNQPDLDIYIKEILDKNLL